LCNTAATAVACGTTPSTGTKYVFTTNGQRQYSTPYSSGTAGTTTNYNWNAYGQLCSTGPSSTPTSTSCGTLPTGGTAYQYNGNGLRTSTTTASTTTLSTWDPLSGGNIPLNINDAATTGSSTTNTSYIYGDLLFGGTAPIEQITTTSSGTSVSYLVSNQTGVQGVYNGSGSSLGAVQEMAIYSVYGIQTISSGSKVTPFGFQGSYTDPTGLIYLINRYYDPATDQFLSVDPAVADTGQPYVYVNDNPLNAADPLGLEIHGTGTATCNTQVHVIFCSGNTSGGQSVLGVIIDLPTAIYAVGIGTVTVTNQIIISGPYSHTQVTVNVNGDVTVTNGGHSVTYSAGGLASASMDLPGAPGLAVGSDGGLSISKTTNGHVGPDHVTLNTTATFYLEGGAPPSAFTYSLVQYGSASAVAAATFAVWWNAKPVCAAVPPPLDIACAVII
jgi:RHS repeat-associated protein